MQVPRTVGRLGITAALLTVAGTARAQEAYFAPTLEELGIAAPAAPSQSEMRWRELGGLLPYAALARGAGEAYYLPGDVPLDGEVGGQTAREPAGAPRIVARGTPGAAGVLVLPNAARTRLERHAFVLPAQAGGAGAEAAFRAGRRAHYGRLAGADLPGDAWFRHRAREADADAPARDHWRVRPSESELVESYALFTGGRALAENLQLERELPEAPPEESGERVALDAIRGITVRAFDWSELLGEAEPELDPLAALVPEDQHALFFPSFDALRVLVDETRRYGPPVLAGMETRSQSARTLERYEAQLCLPLDGTARALGPLAVRSAAVTGSDPYLRLGSDVAVLFEAVEPSLLRAFVAGRQALAPGDDRAVRAVRGEVAGVPYEGVVSPTRRVSSYLAAVGGHVVVANSLLQLERVVRAAAGGPSLAGSDEYRFFRQRYPRGDAAETALLVVPDAAIRRWCGPRWRIAASRRTLALAALTELQAAHAGELAAGVEQPRALEVDARRALGDVRLTPAGVTSERYGSLAFLTPIAELPIDGVSAEERRLYELWRSGYERNWSNFFDPIALRFSVAPERAAIDLTVMPLIGGTDYRDLAELAGDARLGPGAGDPHPESILHFAMAVDVDSEPIREIGEALAGMFSRLGAHPLGWLGGDLALYADESAFWKELAEAEGVEEMVESVQVDTDELPIVLHAGVSSVLKLTTFLTTVRALADSTAPGMLAWDTLETEGGRPYVRVAEKFVEGDYALYYAATPRSWLLSFHEEALRRAVGRAWARASEDGESGAAGGTTPPSAEWQGASVALVVEEEAVEVLELMAGETLEDWLRRQAWSNLPILREWRQVFPGRDPVEVHAELWGEELLCPGGGQYVWDEEWQTLESTAYGHPGEPRDGPGLPPALAGFRALRADLTFEDDGLRARVRGER